MISKRYFPLFLGGLMAGLILAPVGCGRSAGNQEVQTLSQKAAELDKLTAQAASARADEAQKLAQAKILNATPDPTALQLTEEQKTALEARIKAEKNSSYQALLQEVLDKDKEIHSLDARIAQLRAVLPRPEIARANDSHYGMAMRFLRRKGVSEEKAKLLISKVLIMDQIAPGFEVYNYYDHGVYGTWVAQGKADQSPTELQAGQRAKIEGERDAANEESRNLQTKIADLNAQADQLTTDIAHLRDEKTRMTKQLEEMTAANRADVSLLNSVHYLVGTRKDLVDRGIIVTPVFAKDRAGANWQDDAFNNSADLRSADSITITAAEAGLQKIGKLEVIPGSLQKDRHYTLAFNPDRTAATVTFLAKERFRNEKVVFALAD